MKGTRQTVRPGLKKARGFTLIELMVVMSIMAIVTAAVAVGVGNIRGASVQSEAGKLTVAVRYLYNLAVLNGKVHRLVIDIEGGSYWGEVQDSRDPCKMYLLPGETDDEEADSGDTDEEADKPAAASFGKAKTKLLKKRKLKKGVVFGGVMTSHQKQVANSGQAHITIFPNGTAEAAYVYIQDKDDDEDVMTVEVLSLQGAARIHLDKLEPDEFFEQD
ncbi:MAG: prepilin-type N-terminal cleavage/methylation domain-containing protein [Myxococcales bacterium]|nr:prepilin-type N-terminal cleavage/methylation domain-containing protein [Myxococcales bacterium]